MSAAPDSSDARRILVTLRERLTPAETCLAVLLDAIGWRGSGRTLIGAMPHLTPLETVEEMRTVLLRLGFTSRRRTVRLCDVGPSMLPLIIATEGATEVRVLIDRPGPGRLREIAGDTGEVRTIEANGSADVFLIEPADPDATREVIRKVGWMQVVLGRFRRPIATILMLSFAINLLALSVPLFVMAVYDRAIAASSLMTLASLLAAVLLALLLEAVLRTARSRAIAFLGTRIESLVTIGALRHLLDLPLPMIEPAPIPAQLSRLQQFSGIRSVFVGQLGNAIADLPFVLIFASAIFAIGGALGFAPLGLLALFLVIAAVTVPLSRRRVRFAGDAAARARAFMMELVEKHGTIRDNRAEDIWVGRATTLVGQALYQQFRAQQLNVVLQTGSQMLVMVTGIVSVALGALMALDGALSIGALIAVIALIWRLLSPVQAIFLGLNQIGQAIDTVKQLNRLMQMPAESSARRSGATGQRRYRGRITLEEVSLRHTPDAALALRGVSLDIPAGQTVAITGASGAGKTSLLKVIAGLVQPQAGAVRIDGLDLRQIDPAVHRCGIGLVPGDAVPFYGTIAQNLRLARPEATREEMEAAMEMAGAGGLLRALPGGLDTRIRSTKNAIWTDGRLQQLSLARAFVRGSAIYLMDDPGSRLDRTGEKALRAAIWRLSGEATVLLVTHRPSLMRLTDRVVVMAGGRISADGEPGRIVPALLDRLEKHKSRVVAGT